MDKPDLLSQIQKNHPEASLAYIQSLADQEITKQLRESIQGMLSKKPISVLKSVVEYTAISTSGKSVDFDSTILGSNPNIATKKRK